MVSVGVGRRYSDERSIALRGEPPSMDLEDTTAALDLTYEVKVNTPGATYDSLSSELTAAVETGEFTSLMEMYASIYYAPSLANSTTSSISVEPTPIINSGGSASGGSSKDMAMGMIIGIVVAICAIVALMIACIYNAAKSKLFKRRSSEVSITDIEASSTTFNPVLLRSESAQITVAGRRRSMAFDDEEPEEEPEVGTSVFIAVSNVLNCILGTLLYLASDVRQVSNFCVLTTN